MRDRILIRTNVMICLIIVVGFLLTAIFSYQLNYNASMESIEQVSDLTSDSIYRQMANILSKPIHISLTMANDSLLRDVLLQEPAHMEDEGYIETLREYLRSYRETYGYDSVFLVSAASARYYSFNGLDRVLEPGHPENAWYFQGMLQSDGAVAMNVDNDEVHSAENAITMFVNCKIFDNGGALLGVVGVGLRIDYLQGILRGYQEEFGVSAYIVDEDGVIQIAAEHTGYEQAHLFEGEGNPAARERILQWTSGSMPLRFWDLGDSDQKQGYIVARYLPEIGWHLVVERDTSEMIRTMQYRILSTSLTVLVIMIVILYVITHVIRSFNRKIVALERTCEEERKSLFEKATEQMFDQIYELDITRNRPANQVTEGFFERMGVPAGTPYDKALKIIAQKQIKPEFRHGYLTTFLPQNVLIAFQNGTETLRYEFMATNDGTTYYWTRITTRLLMVESDESLHMLVYRQNIDEEKQREQKMQMRANMDEMTGLLNKTALQRAIDERLGQREDQMYAFFIFDIDHFKDANDRFGHAFGDKVIRAFSDSLCACFLPDDLLGRIGGDEFAAFLPVPDETWAVDKARELNRRLDRDYVDGFCRWHMSVSIGVSFAPRDGLDRDALYRRADEALYETKRRGRGSFTLYGRDGQEPGEAP